MKLRRSCLALLLIAALTVSVFPLAVTARPEDDNISSLGTPYASVNAPQGGGNKDIGVICDGVCPELADDYGDMNLQYDTFLPGKASLEEAFGYKFAKSYSFTGVVFQEGSHFDNGGWFQGGSLRVEVLQEEGWKEVSLTNAPNYPSANDRQSFGKSFETYRFEFDPIIGIAIRVVGTAGGEAAFATIAELKVFGAEASDGGDNVTFYGVPTASVSAPQGGGNRDIAVICDGVSPAQDCADTSRQYDTYFPGKTETVESFGYTFPSTVSIHKLVYQEGIHFENGGWFQGGSLRVEVRQNGEWQAVTLTNTPNYPVGNDLASFGASFEIYTFEFEPITGDAIRIIGTAGGDAVFTNIAELKVYGVINGEPDSSPEPVPSFSTTPGPFASVTMPQGGGNKDIGVICDGVKPAVGSDDSTAQYDTTLPDKTNFTEFFGYNYDKVYTFSKVVFQEGCHFDDGGWFANGSLRVEVRLGGEWYPVRLTNDPGYPVANNRQSFGDGFESYPFEFEPILGDAIRIIGTAGGDATFTTVAELEVTKTEAPLTYQNAASLGTPIVSVEAPEGAGSRSPEVLRDGYKPAEGTSVHTTQYDTFRLEPVEGELQYFGYTFPREYTFNKLVYQEGEHFPDGGWFIDELYIEVLQNGEWVDVPFAYEGKEYPLGTRDSTAADYGPTFEVYTMVFEPATGAGLRICGLPGGDKMFVGCGELEVYAAVAQGELPEDRPEEPFENEDPYNITDEELRDKIEGGLIGKMIGVSWGAPTEFRFPGTLLAESDVPAWNAGLINDAFWQDDLYVMMSFAEALVDHGIDASVTKVGEYFRNSTFGLAHGNLAARQNLRAGIPAELAGSYLYNQHCDDIDWQIEADFTGVISPGLVNQAIHQAWRLGHIIGYGDGVYGGVFVGAMYARAYTATSVSEIIEAGRQAVPEGSLFRQMVEECISYYEGGITFEENWETLQVDWGRTDRCPEGCGEFNAFNIDAKMNSIHILLGLLYGEGDFEESIRISMRCGDDSDCNPSSVGGILGAWMGLSHIPKKFTKALDRTATKFSCTDYTVNDFVEAEYQLALETLEQCGVQKTAVGYAIDPDQSIAPAELEQWPDQPSVSVSYSLRSLAITTKANAWDAGGIQTIEWDFGDGTAVDTGAECLHIYDEEGNYTVACTVANRNGNTSTVSFKVSVYDNIALMGTPFAAVTDPQGGGSRSLETIRDGVMPQNDATYELQYDSYGGWSGEGEHEDYYGYTFLREYIFTHLIFQEGYHFENGGWFKDGGPRVQVRQDGEWVDATMLEPVDYPHSDEPFAFGNGFETFQYHFEPIQGDAIRIIGIAGGSSHFSSIAGADRFGAAYSRSRRHCRGRGSHSGHS